MRKVVKEQELTSTQLFTLSYQTCQWWNAIFIQAKRFLEVWKDHTGGDPWEHGEKGSLFVADRMFLIVAIHHAIENLEKLDIELQRQNDTTLHSVIKAIESVAPLQDIKNLRDMNTHSLDYLAEKGFMQDQFRSTIKKGDIRIMTTASWTIVHGDAKLFLLGNVPIDKLLQVMKEQLPFVRAKTEEVFYKSI